MVGERSRNLVYLWTRHSYAVSAKARYGSDMSSASGMWLKPWRKGLISGFLSLNTTCSYPTRFVSQVVEDGYEFFANRHLVTLFSAPNYTGEFDNAGAMMSVDESLMCSFQVNDSLLPVSLPNLSFLLDSKACREESEAQVWGYAPSCHTHAQAETQRS